MFLRALLFACTLGTLANARDITDMGGRAVTLPDEVNSIITVGAVPVLNTLVFAAGEGGKLAMRMPDNWTPELNRFQFVFAPQLATNPSVQDSSYTPDLEKIIALAPDVALTFDRSMADTLAANGVSAVMMRIGTPDEIKAGVGLVGEIFGDPALGDRYAEWFDAMGATVAARLADLPPGDRPTILYINPVIMTQPHLIAEWWIPAGGGTSVTAGERSQNVLALTTEAVIAANPDYLIVMEPSHLDRLREDPILSQLEAVKEGRAIVLPRGAHVWGNRGVELALAPLWLASVLHPDRVPHAELIAETQRFYTDFFKTTISEADVESILAGGLAPAE